jgi:hypothetical protein
MKTVVIPDNIDPESKKQLVRLFQGTEEAIEEAVRHFSQVSLKPKEFKSWNHFLTACDEGQSQYSKLMELQEYLHVSLELLNGRNPHE